MARIFVTFPKYSSYQYKAPELQRHYRSTMSSVVEEFMEKGKTVNMLAEDLLALTLFGDNPGIRWITSFSERDKKFMVEHAAEYPSVYGELVSDTCSKTVRDFLQSQLQAVSIRECGGDMEKYKSLRIKYLQDKISLTIRKMSGTCLNLLQFVDGNNYCKPAAPSMGDGRLIVTVDLVSTSRKTYYGGCAIEADQVDALLEVL